MIPPTTAPATGLTLATRPAPCTKARSLSELEELELPIEIWKRLQTFILLIFSSIERPRNIQQEHRYTIDSVKTLQNLSRSETLKVYL